MLTADQELATELQTAACHLTTLLAERPGAGTGWKALLNAVLQALAAQQKAIAPLQTCLCSAVLLAAAEGTHLPVPGHYLFRDLALNQRMLCVRAKGSLLVLPLSQSRLILSHRCNRVSLRYVYGLRFATMCSAPAGTSGAQSCRGNRS